MQLQEDLFLEEKIK